MYELAQMKSNFKKNIKDILRKLTYDGYKTSLDSSGNLRLQWKIWVSVSPQGIFEEATEDKGNGLLLFELFTLQGRYSELKSRCGCFLQEGVSLDDQVIKALTFVMNNNYREILPSKAFNREVVKDFQSKPIMYSFN